MTAECTCAEVEGENPECALHGVVTDWALENTDPCDWQEQVLKLRAVLATRTASLPAPEPHKLEPVEAGELVEKLAAMKPAAGVLNEQEAAGFALCREMATSKVKDFFREFPAPVEASVEGVGELVEHLNGPHEWGYRDPVVGGFIEDGTPFNAADALERLTQARQQDYARGIEDAAKVAEEQYAGHEVFTTARASNYRHAARRIAEAIRALATQDQRQVGEEG